MYGSGVYECVGVSDIRGMNRLDDNNVEREKQIDISWKRILINLAKDRATGCVYAGVWKLQSY